MTCEDALTLLAEALTEVGASVPADVEQHLAACAGCSARAAAMRATVETIRPLAAAEVDDVAPPSFESILAGTRRPARRVQRALVRAAILALAALGGAAADRLLLARAPSPEGPIDVHARARTEERRREALRREVAARPGGLGASLAVLAALDDRR